MIIVSQDKKRVVQNLNLGISRPGEYSQNYIIYNTELGEELGEYKTEERAKEVLQEIIKYYNSLKRKSVYAMGDSGFTFEEKFYYEMPKE